MKEILKRKRLFSILILFSFFSVFPEENDQTLFLNGNKAYTDKDYKTAIFYYNQLLSHGFDNYSVNYNLGCAHYKLNQLGYARYYFEKAFIHSPFNKDLKEKISLVTEKIYGNEGEEDNLFIKRILLIINPYLSITLFLLLFSICFVCFFLLIRKYNRKIFIFSTISFILSLFLFIFALTQNSVINDNSAIIIKNSDIYLAPYSTTVISTIAEGKKVSIIKQENREYYMIKLSDSTNGWLKQENLMPIHY